MMPLTLANVGEESIVRKVSGNPEVRKHLEDLGFVAGAHITIISQLGDGNIIVNVKESRLAITSQMASKVMVVPQT